MRHLVTIQKIQDLQPIPGADAIEVATVLGWHVVVKRGEFKVGDLCVYFETDSFLPADDPRFEFLKSSGIKKMLVDGIEEEGIRLRTIRLRGQISQGLCLPLSTIPQSLGRNFLEEGNDVTFIFNVHKYEPPLSASLSGVAKGSFPSFIPKTDEPRIQTNPQILSRYKDKIFYVTEKVDGSSVTVYYKDGELNVCSRSLNLVKDLKNSFWDAVDKLNLESKLKDTPYALQGELIGEGIQGNHLKITGHKILFYNVYDFISGQYLNGIMAKAKIMDLDLEFVPIIDIAYQLPEKIDQLVEYATRNSEINDNVPAEGIVIRPLIETEDLDLGRLSFKCINPEYLIKHGE